MCRLTYLIRTVLHAPMCIEKSPKMARGEIGNGGSMLPALSERPSEERRTGAGVVGNDFTQRRGTGIHGDHAPRAETRNGTGLPLLSGRHSTAAGDCSIEQGCLVRIVNFTLRPEYIFGSRVPEGAAAQSC